MHTEIELKLSTDPTTLQAIYQESFLAQNAWQQQTLHSDYFDDACLTLKAQQMALRIRRDGTQKVQTLKIRKSNQDGLANYGEFEAILPPNAQIPDLSLIKIEMLPNLGELKLIFNTIFKRLSCQLNIGASIIEVALDLGSVNAGNKSSPICELELELISGKIEDIYVLSKKLQHQYTLTPSNISKAAKGFKLLNF